MLPLIPVVFQSNRTVTVLVVDEPLVVVDTALTFTSVTASKNWLFPTRYAFVEIILGSIV